MIVKHKKKATVAKPKSAPTKPKPKRLAMFPKKPEPKPEPRPSKPATFALWSERPPFAEPAPSEASPLPKAEAPKRTAEEAHSDKIHAALLNLQVEVAGGIPYLSYQMLTANAVDAIIAKLQECNLTIK